MCPLYPPMEFWGQSPRRLPESTTVLTSSLCCDNTQLSSRPCLESRRKAPASALSPTPSSAATSPERQLRQLTPPLHLTSLTSPAGPWWPVILHSLTLPLALTSYLLQLHIPHLPIGSQSWTGLGRGTRVNESHTYCPWCRMVKKMKHLAVWHSASHFSFLGLSVFISGKKRNDWTR